MIDGNTKLVGLIGWPVAHSLSPIIHNAAFNALSINTRYFPLPVQPGYIDEAIRGLVVLGFLGANVTIPHKQSLMPALDAIASNVKAIGAVNTIAINRDGETKAIIKGFNTDDQGFLIALTEGGFNHIKGKRAVIVGAGGASRAVIYGLLSMDIKTIDVLNRSSEHLQKLISSFSKRPDWSTRLHAYSLDEEKLIELTRTSDLLINTTPVGMWPDENHSIWPDEVPIPPHLTIFDLVYNPQMTKLLKQAQASGANAICGLEMLVQQAGLSFEIWFNIPAPINVMRAACVNIKRR